MEKPLLLKIGVVALVGVGGYFVGSQTSKTNHREESIVAHALERKGDARRVSIVSSGALDALLKEADSRKRTKALAQLSLDLKVGEYEGFLDRIRKEAGFLTFHSLYLDVLEEWAVVDPKSALLYVSKLEESLMSNAIRVIIDCWMDVDEDAAVKWTKGLPKSRFRGGVEDYILTRIGTKDINRFISLLQENRVKLSSIGDYFMVWNTWVEKDPRALVESVTRISSLSQRSDAYHLVIEAWATRDANAALSWTLELPPGDFRSSLIERALEHLCKLDPKRALEIGFSELNEMRRRRLSEVALSNWLSSDRASALAFIEKMPVGEFREWAISDTLSNFAAIDPASAAAWVDSNSSFGRTWVPMVASLWGEKDRGAAIAWIEKEPDEGIRKNAMAGIFESWGKIDPEKAIQAVMELPPGKVDDGVVAGIFAKWIERDFAAGYRWLSRNQSKVPRGEVGKLVVSIADNHLLNATALAELMPGGEESDRRAFEMLGGAWAMYAPDEGLDQLDRIVEGRDRKEFLFGYVSRLADEDPSAAWAIVQSQPEGELRDRLAKWLVDNGRGGK